jgi:hypothetical protein
MIGNFGVLEIGPVANPSLREGKRRRLIRMTKDSMAKQLKAGQVGPMRQVAYRDEVVGPLALNRSALHLLLRVQDAIGTILSAKSYVGDLSETIPESVLRWHEWEIALALREITELQMEASSAAQETPGPMTTAVLASQKKAVSVAWTATYGRVEAIERLAAQVASAEAARRDWETAQQVAARNAKYLDLVARTAADEHASLEISNLADQAAEAARVFRETLTQATLAAEALVLPDAR